MHAITDEPWHYAKWNKPVTQKDKNCVSPFLRGTQSSQTKEKNRMMGAKDWREWEMKSYHLTVSVLQDEKSSVAGWGSNSITM